MLDIKKDQKKVIPSDNFQSDQMPDETTAMPTQLIRALAFSLDTILLADSKANIVYVNETMLKNSGYVNKDVIGSPMTSLWVHPNEFTCQIMTGLMKKQPWQGQLQHKSKNGSVFWEAVTISPVMDDTGIVTHFIKIGQLFNQVRSDQQAGAVKENYQKILDLMSDGYLETDLKGNVTFLNKSTARIYQRSSEELIGQNYRAYMSPTEADNISQLFNKIYKTGTSGEIIDYEIIGKDGQPVSCETITSLLCDYEGNPVGFGGIIRDVTEKKEIVRLLEENEESYRRVMELAPDAITITRVSDGKYFEVNEAFCQQTGYPRHEVIGRTVDEINIYANLEDREHIVSALRTEGRISSLRMTFRHRDGSPLHDIVSARIILFKGNECVLFVGTLINSLIEAQTALEESEKRYRMILGAAPDSISLTRMSDGQYIEANEVFYTRTGYSPEETIGQTAIDLKIYADEGDRKRFLTALRKKNHVTGMEISTRYKDGTISIQLWSGRIIEYDGQTCVLVVAKEIDDLKRAQHLLEEREESYRTIIQTAPISMAVMQPPEMRYVTVNKKFCDQTGYTEDEIIGKTTVELGLFEDQRFVEEIMGKLRRDGKVDAMISMFRTKSGRIIQSLSHITPIKHMGKRCFLSSNVDVTSLRQTQSALRESESRFRAIFETAADAIFVTEPESGKFLDINQAASQHLGFDEKELLGMTINNVVHPKHPYQKLELDTHGNQPKQLFFESLHICKDSSLIPVEVSSTVVVRSGQPVVLSIVRDVSERKRTEAELEQHRHHLEKRVKIRTQELEDVQNELVKKGKMSVLGQLTATVSHELRNPLGVIRSSNFYLKRKIKEKDEKVDKHIKRIEDQVGICDTIVADLLEYTRGRQVSVTKQDIQPWLTDVVEQMIESEQIDIRVDIEEKLPAISHDQEKMRRVVINLLDNAVQAVRARQGVVGDVPFTPDILLKLGQRQGSLYLQVSDNGMGMDEETSRRAFEPLFTTRARGTGIGLANVSKIISEHGGSIELETKPLVGTTLTILLPYTKIS